MIIYPSELGILPLNSLPELETRLWVGRSTVQIPEGTSDSSLLYTFQFDSGVHSASYSMITAVLSRKLGGQGVELTITSLYHPGYNPWSYNRTPLYTLSMAWTAPTWYFYHGRSAPHYDVGSAKR
jgi:hypothetical protein